MKPSSYTDTSLLRQNEEDERPGEIWGVLLAGDYTAEHEQGISGILGQLGIDDKGITIPGRSMADGGRNIPVVKGTKTEANYVKAPTQKNPSRLARKKQVSKAKALSTQHDLTTLSQIVFHAPRYDFEKEVTGAWSSSHFALVGWSDEAKSFIDDFSKALENADVTVWTGGALGNPFARNGLILAITSRIPEKGAAMLNAADEEEQRLQEASEKSGIKRYLKDRSSKGKISLPRFRTDPWTHLKAAWSKPDDDTKHPVKFYLIPADRDLYESGWYTVEELKLWGQGKGPVIKN